MLKTVDAFAIINNENSFLDICYSETDFKDFESKCSKTEKPLKIIECVIIYNELIMG